MCILYFSYIVSLTTLEVCVCVCARVCVLLRQSLIHLKLSLKHCFLDNLTCDMYGISLALETNTLKLGFPGGSDSKEFTCNAGDLGSIPGSERSPGEGNGYPLQYSFLENSMDRGAWWAIVHGVTKSWTRLRN